MSARSRSAGSVEVHGEVPDSSREGRAMQRYAENGARLVAGCIPTREGPDGSLEVLLITSRNGRGWVFPKGGWETDETLETAAKRETLEEAGVRGRLEDELIGVFSFESDKKERKMSADRGACTAYVYVLQVAEELPVWPECRTRERKWVSPLEALELCRHEWMRQALSVFVERIGGDSCAAQRICESRKARASSSDIGSQLDPREHSPSPQPMHHSRSPFRTSATTSGAAGPGAAAAASPLAVSSMANGVTVGAPQPIGAGGGGGGCAADLVHNGAAGSSQPLLAKAQL